MYSTRRGSSTNSNYQNLLNDFTEVVSFLDNNYIIYNNYSEFAELVNAFMEGLFMVHSLNERQSQRLVAIDDPLLILISKFTSRETIIKYYKRVHLLGLKYTQNSKGTLIEQSTIKFLNDYQNFGEHFGDDVSLPKQFFWDKYRRILANLMLFVTISNSKTINYNLIFERLIEVFQNETFLMKYDDSIISDFIKEKGKYFNNDLLKKFLKLAINNEKFHEEEIFAALKIQISKYHPTISISDNETFELIISYFLKECSKCNVNHHTEILVCIYFILCSTLQEQLLKRVKSVLHSEFKPELYYKFAIHGIIDDKDLFDSFQKQIQPFKESGQQFSFYNYSVVNHFQFSELLNLYFKYNIDSSIEKLQKFKGMSDYYDWLLDMDNFDYKKFNPKWILAYRTDAFLNRIFKNKKVSAYLKVYLKKSKHPVLSELFIYWT